MVCEFKDFFRVTCYSLVSNASLQRCFFYFFFIYLGAVELIKLGMGSLLHAVTTMFLSKGAVDPQA